MTAQQTGQCHVNNFHRAAAAGIANARICERALELLGSHIDPRWRNVAEARIANPVATWRQIGATLGMSKDQAAGIFWRMAGAVGAEEEWIGRLRG